MRAVTRVSAFGAALTVWMSSFHAAAFCQTTTCDPATEPEGCEEDADGCIISGLPLQWRTACVSFGVHATEVQEATGVQTYASVLRNIDFATAETIISDAYSSWISVDCGGFFPSIEIAAKGQIACGIAEYSSDFANANVWIFRDQDWPHAAEAGVDGTLAFTFVTFSTDTGEIYDADVEINSFGRELTTSDTAVVDDLSSIVTHEIGHFFGLSHSAVVESTMTSDYQSGDTTLRSLDPDDAAAMCAIYFPGRQAEQNDCEPRHGFSRDCAADQMATGGVAGTGGMASTAGSAGTMASTGGSSGAPVSTGGAPETPGGKSGGCSCRIRASTEPRATGSGLGLALLLVLSRVRRRRA